MTLIKICCIQDAAEASLAIAHGADAVGLVSEMPSGPGPVPEATITAVIRSLPAGFPAFLLTSTPDATAIISQVRRTGAGTVQIVDRLMIGSHRDLREALPGVTIVQVIHVEDERSAHEAVGVHEQVDAILLDSGRPNQAVKELGGTGRVHDWTVSRHIREAVRVPVWLAGGLTAGNVAAAIGAVRPHGVDVCSGVRTNGRLDATKLAAFVAAVRAADEPGRKAAFQPAPPGVSVRRHHFIVRLTHWVNTVALVGMMASGLQIYGAYPHFGLRGAPLPVLNPFDNHVFGRWARLGGWLAGGLNWHFFLMWILAANGLLYVLYLVLSGELRHLAFRPRDIGPAIQMQLYYLRLRRDHPAQGKHNALQKGAYTFIVVLGALSILSGLALWKPVQLALLTAAFGGYELTRLWHFLAVWLFTGFILLHVVLVFVVDPASMRAMITGWYRGRFPSG